jgi:hypothetical protein
MLKPELQSLRDFAAGVENIVTGQRQAAQLYFDDGSVEAACPPLKALLHIMVHGSYQGMTLESRKFRALFTRENVLKSAWYKERLLRQQAHDTAHWRGRVAYLKGFMEQAHNRNAAKSLNLNERLARAQKRLAETLKPGYVESLTGTIGLDAVGG